MISPWLVVATALGWAWSLIVSIERVTFSTITAFCCVPASMLLIDEFTWLMPSLCSWLAAEISEMIEVTCLMLLTIEFSASPDLLTRSAFIGLFETAQFQSFSMLAALMTRRNSSGAVR